MRSLVGLLLITCFFIHPVSAQFDKLKKRLEDEFSKEAKESVKKKKKDKTPTIDWGKMLGSSDMELEESYAYDFQIDWLITSEDADDLNEMSQFFTRSGTYMGMEGELKMENEDPQPMHVILDVERSYMIILNDENAQALVWEFENIEAQLDQEQEEAQGQEAKVFRITKTGKTKMIAGYLCHQYLYEGEEGEGEMWATKQIDYDSFDMFAYFKKIGKEKQVSQNSIWNQPDKGFVLKIKGLDSEGKPFEMEAQKVDERADISYDMSEYQTIDLTGLSKGLGGFKN